MRTAASYAPRWTTSWSATYSSNARRNRPCRTARIGSASSRSTERRASPAEALERALELALVFRTSLHGVFYGSLDLRRFPVPRTHDVRPRTQGLLDRPAGAGDRIGRRPGHG